ncbi:MAG: hypothetical protein OSB19_00625 [Opitutaceae bacterium]|jgi:hypothetical protein|nr:hypothetical protein [Opitutaceae bacterium]
MPHHEIDPEAEAYAYSVTRKMFYYTVGGTVAFSATIILLWYVF